MKVLKGDFKPGDTVRVDASASDERALVLARKWDRERERPATLPRPGRLLEGTEPRLGEVGRQLTRRGGIPATRSAGSPCCTPCHAS